MNFTFVVTLPTPSHPGLARSGRPSRSVVDSGPPLLPNRVSLLHALPRQSERERTELCWHAILSEPLTSLGSERMPSGSLRAAAAFHRLNLLLVEVSRRHCGSSHGPKLRFALAFALEGERSGGDGCWIACTVAPDEATCGLSSFEIF